MSSFIGCGDILQLVQLKSQVNKGLRLADCWWMRDKAYLAWLEILKSCTLEIKMAPELGEGMTGACHADGQLCVQARVWSASRT